MEDVIQNQVYEHYKGGKYLVLFVADDATDKRDGNTLVVYVSLTYGKVYCRDLSEFVEVIEWSDGTKQPRFIPSNSV